MRQSFAARGVVRACACVLSILAVGAATSSRSMAQTQAPDRAAFAAAWESGTPITVTGELTVMVADDFAHKRAERVYFIRDRQSGLSFQLRFDQEPAGLRSGSVVTVSGRSSGLDIYAAAHQMTSSSKPDMPSLTAEAGVQAAAAVSGDQRTLVMMVNFTDASLSCSASEINDTMFADPAGQSVNALYHDNSRGLISFSGKVTGPYTINYPHTGCDINNWLTASEAAATAAGVDVASYPRHVIVMPENACPAAGYGSGAGAASSALIFSCGTKGVYAHELGHNLGMDHASSYANGQYNEYGDGSDPMAMAGSGLPGLNAPHRHQLGWSSPLLITQGGTYNVAPLAPTPSGTATQSYIIPKTDTGEYYYLSYRTVAGYDATIQPYYLNGLSVHRFSPVLDAGGQAKTYLLAELADGQSFADAVNGITVSLVNHNSTQATASVNFQCVGTTPSISLSPQAQSGTAGSSVSYVVSVVNRDGSTCSTSSFALSAAVPAAWGSNFAPASLSLLPGATGQATLTVTSAPSAPAGTYAATVKAAAQSSLTASAAATYTVTPPADTVAPSAPAGLTASVNSKLKQIQLAWSAASDNVGVAGYRVLRNGVQVGTSPTNSWSDSGYSSGATYVYSVAAYDAAGNVSPASNSVTVTLTSGGKRK
jgi:gametolysin peptidase M11/alpha-galactosidase-like protein